MSAVEMREQTVETSPLLIARIAGACWLLTILAGIFGLYVWNSLVVSGDAAATATNILTNEFFFRSGTAATLISTGTYIGATLFVYELLKPVNRSVSLLATFFSLVGCSIWAVGGLFEFSPFVLLKSSAYSSVFTTEQLQTFTLILLKIGGQASNVGSIFFGMQCLLTGYLILKSSFLPRFVGALMIFGGLGWLTFLAPAMASSLSPFIMMPGTLGELTLALWLLIKGVNVERWKEQVGAG